MTKQHIITTLSQLGWQESVNKKASGYWVNPQQPWMIRVSDHLPWAPGSSGKSEQTVKLSITVLPDSSACRVGPTMQTRLSTIQTLDIGELAENDQVERLIRETLQQL